MEKKDIEIPFGAFDSELCGFEYTIPEGYEAEIKNGKVVVKKIESEDEKVRKMVLKAFKLFAEKQSWIGHCLDDIDWDKCIAYLEKQGEQKPAWSEEDEKMLDDIIEASTHHCYLNITDIEWLKSLKERIQPQPKQEWSEEDEYLLDETIKHLESLIRIIEKQGSAYSDEIQYYQRDIDWLKSLRPQKWRPTEDQIMCLQDAISNYQHRGYKAETLESLCKQLKQL